MYLSLLIGGSITALRERLLSEQVHLILSVKLLAEIREQTTKSKFAKYFTPLQAAALLDLLCIIADVLPDGDPPKQICRDPDDDYLLALCKTAKAHVLLTGDTDLLVLKKYGRTRIMNARTFVNEFVK